jgi:hypothetical protein
MATQILPIVVSGARVKVAIDAGQMSAARRGSRARHRIAGDLAEFGPAEFDRRGVIRHGVHPLAQGPKSQLPRQVEGHRYYGARRATTSQARWPVERVRSRTSQVPSRCAWAMPLGSQAGSGA